MIQCVGSRIPVRPYCSRIAALRRLKTRLNKRIKSKGKRLYSLSGYSNLWLFGRVLHKSPAGRVILSVMTWKTNRRKRRGKNLRVSVYDPALGKNVVIDSNMLILSSAILPRKPTNSPG
jgi:heterodisulfide reductase subunit A